MASRAEGDGVARGRLQSLRSWLDRRFALTRGACRANYLAHVEYSPVGLAEARWNPKNRTR